MSTAHSVGRVDRKTGRPGDRREPAYEMVERGGEQRLVVRSFELARAILRRPTGLAQAGFNAETVSGNPALRPPMLFVEGEAHHEQRRLAARYFAPKTVATRHRQMIVELADQLVSELERSGGGRLDVVSFRLALRVVCEVVGLTESDVRAMERLLDAFFAVPPPATAPRLRRLKYHARQNARTLRFYLQHVRPAVRARRAQPRDDVISGLLERGLRDRDLLIECLTYAAAGMVTTRQFIALAAWQLIEHDALLARFRQGSPLERRAILDELVRLDTVAGNLLRRTVTPLTLDTPHGPLTVPEGTVIDLEIRAANADESVFGADAMELNPDRCPAGRAPLAGLAFGAGHHSCPGEHLAMEESDVFLQRFFRGDWTIEAAPTIDWNDVVLAYDIQGLVVRPAPQIS